MSLKPTDSQRSFYHTSTLCGEMFGVSDRYRLFREKILPKLFALRGKLGSLYWENNGGPALDPVMLCGVTLLQFMEKVADRAASEHVVYHLGWKYALDLELCDEGFHSTVLVYFRDRLEEKKAERAIFDGVLELLVELGLVKRKGKQRLDSTHTLGYVKEMSRVEGAVGGGGVGVGGVKRKGKQRLDSTHILGYVKEMSRLECAVETVRLALEDLAGAMAGGKR